MAGFFCRVRWVAALRRQCKCWAWRCDILNRWVTTQEQCPYEQACRSPSSARLASLISSVSLKKYYCIYRYINIAIRNTQRGGTPWSTWWLRLNPSSGARGCERGSQWAPPAALCANVCARGVADSLHGRHNTNISTHLIYSRVAVGPPRKKHSLKVQRYPWKVQAILGSALRANPLYIQVNGRCETVHFFTCPAVCTTPI